MLLAFGHCQENGLQSKLKYSPIVAYHKTVAAVERRFRKTDRSVPASVNYGPAHKVNTPEVEEDLGLDLRVGNQLLHPVHVQRIFYPMI